MNAYFRVCLLAGATVGLTAPLARAQGAVLLREVVSREHSIHVGGVETTPFKELASREVSVQVESGAGGFAQVISREQDLAIDRDGAPPAVAGLQVTVSPTGDSAVLDWSGYNQWATGDIVRFDVYLSDAGPFSDVSGMTPLRSVAGGSTGVALDGLTPYRDHYFAVVAVDALGNANPAVTYSAAYILGGELVSREISLFSGTEPEPPYRWVVSREYDLAVVSPAPPPAITGLGVTASPLGDTATLDWSGYNQWAVGDITGFEVYLTDSGPFTGVGGMTPHVTLGAGATSVTLDGLAAGRDHYFAVVPVDGLGNREPMVNYAAAYVLSPGVASREFSVFVGQEPASPLREVVAREASLLVGDNTTPAPVTGEGSGFSAVTSTSAFGAVDLDWTSYNEVAQVDVVRYRVYVAEGYFDNVTGLTPYQFVPSGRLTATVGGFSGGSVRHFAVVAEDVSGNFNPVVRSFSAQASISAVGEVVNLAGESRADSILFTWNPPPDAVGFLQGYRLYFGGAGQPVELNAAATSWEATGLAAATGYPFRIATVDLFGNESGGLSLSGATWLPNPANAALTLRDGQVVMTWDAAQPAPLVAYYEVYSSHVAFTDIGSASKVAAGPAREAVLGALPAVQGRHFAVATVNTLGGRDPAVVSLVADKQTQTIDFPPPVVNGAAPVPLPATASSGLPVAFSVLPTGLGTLDTSGPLARLLPVQGGRVTVTASQAGDADYWPAEAVARELRLPPVIASFTANGVEIAEGAVLDQMDELLRVVALDTDGIARAEFLLRPAGGSFVSLGVDLIPGNGLSVVLPIDAHADGPHELKVVVGTPEGVAAELTRAVVLQLGAPPPPVLTAPADGSRTDVAGVALSGTTQRGSEVRVLRNGVEVAGPLVPDAAGLFQTTVPLVPGANILTARATNRAGESAPSSPRTVTLRSILTVAVDPPAVGEGQSATVTVSRNHNQGATQVSLTGNVAGQLNLPSPLLLADGASQVSGSIVAIDDEVPELDGGVTVTANASSYLPGSFMVTVLDNDRPTLTLSLNRSTISEGASAGELLATFTRTPVTATPFTVQVGIAGAAAFNAPATVTIPALAGSVTVPVDPVDNAVIDGNRAAYVYGRILDVTTGEALAESNEAAVTVTDDDGPALSLWIERATVAEGAAVNAILRRNSGLQAPLAVALSVDDETEAGVPAEVSFAVNQAELGFPVQGIDDGAADGSQAVLVRASAAGFAAAEAGVVVSDLQLPEIAISRLVVPATAVTDDLLSYSYRIENQGAADVAGPLSVRVSLSKDPLLGDDTVVENYLFDGGLPAGLFFERAGSLFTPRETGQYWILVEADVGNTHEEILETNNLRAGGPVVIGAAYQATASTTVTIAPGGTPVPITGHATQVSGSAPAAFKLVNVHVMVRGTKRVLSALTDSQGDFALTFTPLPGEGGSYTIGATHPGVTTAAAQDSFTLLGFAAQPPSLAATVTRDGAPATGSVDLTNLADLAMTGLQVSGAGLPAGFSAGGVVRGGATAVAALGTFTVDYEIAATTGAPASASGFLRVTSAEGAQVDIPLDLTARDQASRLVWDGGRLERAMVPGQASFVELLLRNEGSVASGPVRIVLPPVGWLSAATVAPAPPIPPGGSASISLLLNPPPDLPLTAYEGTLQLSGDHNTVTVPFTFRAVSEARTAVTVRCEDEYTYFAANTPPLAGATVNLLDAVDGSVVATAVSGADGRALFDDVREGYYRVKASAAQHASFERTWFVVAGAANEFRAFLSRQTVQYVWNVVPTTVEDRYEIVLETVFETNVPAPVVTIEPAFIDLTKLTTEVTQVDFKITNHGLIAANNVRVAFASTSQWQVTSLAEQLGTLPAKSSITVPLIIRRLADPGGRAGDCGTPAGRVDWCFPCGPWRICGTAMASFQGWPGDCTASIGGGSGGEGGGNVVINPVPFGGGGAVLCDPCLLKSLVDCAISFIPDPVFTCVYGVGGTILTCWQEGFSTNCIIDTVQSGVGCVCGFFPVAGQVCNVVNCYIDILQCLAASGQGGGARSGPPTDEAVLRFDMAGRAVVSMVDFQVALFGDEAWRTVLNDPEIRGFLTLLQPAMGGTGVEQKQIDATERQALLATPFAAARQALVGEYCDRWNRTIDYYERGIRESEDVPAGESTDFLTASSLTLASLAVVEAFDTARAEGYRDPLEAFFAAKDEMFRYLSQGGGTCAKVKLRLEQEAVMTRDAFAATLELSNNTEAPVEGIEVGISVRDSGGADVTALFGITPPVVSGVTNGDVAGNTTGKWEWTIIPSQDAAPLAPVVYQVEGTLRYTAEGQMVTVPLAPCSITVHPNPSLRLKYFHQRDVYADDPHTDVVEPAIPFTLGVMVENRGAGTARNLRITSGQPVIVENEKGLFIDFDIIATEVAGQNLSPGLTAEFGDLAPGQTKVGRWLMTSNLQGLFIDYQADFEHLDSLGNERLSLIEGVEIHEAIRQVRALGARDDGLPDFLVNDVPDVQDRPDTVHLSDGTTEPVAVVESAGVPAPAPGQLTVALSAPQMAAGWSYLRIPEPGGGAFRLKGVTRSDGLVIPLDVNVWTTDRTFLGLGVRPVRENILHLLDFNSTGAYTLQYEVVPPPDTVAPVSAVAALPAASGSFIPLGWGGTDNVGITGFDIHVSTNGGPFTLWLENTRQTSALFTGALGASYGFHSIARDAAGNREAAKTAADASTTVSLENQAPVLDPVPDLTVEEGKLLLYRVSAEDPDGPEDLLRYSLSSPQPGIVIDSRSGEVRWATGEQHGGITAPVTVTVTDGAAEPKSASREFHVTVIDVNAAPRLSDPGSHLVDVGELLEVRLAASDEDQPPQNVGFRFAGTPPAGMTLDGASGVLRWIPGDEHEGQTFSVPLEAFDDQVPAGIGGGTLRVEVLKKPGLPPVFDAVPALVWAEAGSHKQLFRARDPEGEPVALTIDGSGLPGWVKVVDHGDGSGTLYWNTTGVTPGTYEVPLLAATSRQQTNTVQPIQVVPRAAHVNYPQWATAYGLGGYQALSFTRPLPTLPENLLCYGLGIDPVGGISPAQPEPRPRMIIAGGLPGLRFLMPEAGRPDLRYAVERSPDLTIGSWQAVATKENGGAWTGPATVQTEPAVPGMVWVTVVPGDPLGAGGFLRLRVDRLDVMAGGFATWPGTGEGTLRERALADANHDGVANLMAYALGAPSAGAGLPASGILPPGFGLEAGNCVLSATLATGPRDDLIYLLETSGDARAWVVSGWWSTEGSDQSVASFQFEPAAGGKTTLRVVWPRGVEPRMFARLVVRIR